MQVYQACVLSTLLYGSETWTLYSCQEHRLNSLHLRKLWRILGISWQDLVNNKSVLAMAGLPSMYALLTQRRLCWLCMASLPAVPAPPASGPSDPRLNSFNDIMSGNI
ncbi:hypothetical protein JOB18_036004 [Solea senegalensis]|uniref:Uncharacterized protein n=1 Tax=Solea senegalensis TaxID=28829 RepID=A0AAV6T8Z2_SOLSE|nr:hypothetical protein JOB18_036004 [Solea senegalensis]